jgi:transcriptional regulator with XRE-family HTH domain
MNPGLNLVGPQIKKWRQSREMTQEAMTRKLQLLGWSISRHSLAKLELQLRRVPDCELVFIAKVLGVSIDDLFPKNLPLRKLGPQFQTGGRLALFPTRNER